VAGVSDLVIVAVFVQGATLRTAITVTAKLAGGKVLAELVIVSIDMIHAISTELVKPSRAFESLRCEEEKGGQFPAKHVEVHRRHSYHCRFEAS
jgi:hypothetical protein